MKKLHNYPSMLGFSALACILMIAAQLSMICRSTLLKPEFYMENIKQSKADEAVYNELDAFFTQLQSPTDIPKEVFTKSMTMDNVSGSTRQLAKSSILYITGKSASKPEVVYDFEELEGDITQYIESYSDENGIEKDDEYYKLINKTIETCETRIKAKLDVMMLKKFSETPAVNGIRKLAPCINIAIVMTVIFILAVILAMYITDKHHPFDLLYWVGCSIFASSMVMLVPSFYLKHTGFFDGFFVENESIYRAMTGMLYSITDKIYSVNLVLAAAGIVMMTATQIIYMIRVRKH